MKRKMGDIIVYFFASSIFFTQISPTQADKLLKISKKLKELHKTSLRCISIQKIKKIIKALNVNNTIRRNKAYNVFKNYIYCEEMKKYIEENFDKLEPMVQYLILNAIYEKSILLNIPSHLNRDTKKFASFSQDNIDVKAYIDYLSFVTTTKDQLFINISYCLS
ncbi:MAG: hypothetical protein ACK4NF_00275, partial [Planctomycetota bacterium]